MLRRILIIFVLAALTSSAAMAGIFHHKKKENPLANLNSKQPDKVLFDRGMDAMNHGKFDVARLSFQTLINTYPDSEYIARAKLGIGDAWYREGGSTALAQAEIEYKDFETFFPNMPEAAEAQLKVANIHYKQMEKPDRDYTHALRAQEEYRQLILQFPDSKLVPVAEQRLRDVQEVLAQREYDIGKFYFIRESWPAAIARLQSLADAYPLYSNVDDALYLLGSAYEKQIAVVRNSKLSEALKGKLIAEDKKQAAAAYARIITRYPAMDRADDARGRLKALGFRVPTPTPQALALNKAEQKGREEPSHFSRLMGNFHHSPNVSEAAKSGTPSLSDPEETSAVQIERAEMGAMTNSTPAAGGNSVTLQTVDPKSVPESAPLPHTDEQTPAASAPANDQGGDNSIPELAPLNSGDTAAQSPPAAAQPANAAPAPANSASAPANSAPAPANSAANATGNAQQTAPLPPPPQVNDAAAGNPTAAQSSDNQGTSTSKKKKKKGLHKLNPF